MPTSCNWSIGRERGRHLNDRFIRFDDYRYHRIEVTLWYLTAAPKMETYFNDYALSPDLFEYEADRARWRRYVAERMDQDIAAYLIKRNDLFGSLLGPRLVVEYEGNTVVNVQGVEIPYELRQTKDQVTWAYRHAALKHFSQVGKLNLYVPNAGDVNDPIWGQIEPFGPTAARLEL